MHPGSPSLDHDLVSLRNHFLNEKFVLGKCPVKKMNMLNELFIIGKLLTELPCFFDTGNGIKVFDNKFPVLFEIVHFN